MTPERDTVLYILNKSQEYLKSLGIPSPRLDAEILLADLLGLERIKLYSGFDRKLNEEEKNEYRERIRSRGTFRPVAYITGKKGFYKSNFLVNPSVLIPRPETEELVEWVLKENQNSEIDVLDLCTGSGCIGISLKKERPDWNISLSDISSEALETAGKNSFQILNYSLALLNSDLFSEIPVDKKFHILVSNPPYIPNSEKPSIMKDVIEFEPDNALFIDDPESFIFRLLKDSKNHLHPKSYFYIEIHQNFGLKIQEIAIQLGFSDVVIKKDLSGKDRMVRIQL